MPLDLPDGWVSTPAPEGGLSAKWEAVRDHRLPDGLRAFSSKESHALTLQLVKWSGEVGDGDHWQTPEESLAKGSGDCEDMALFERALLLNGLGEGFADKLWLLIVRDLLVKIDHALLWTPIRFIDCRAPRPLEHRYFRHYRPIAAFSSAEAVTFGRRRG